VCCLDALTGEALWDYAHPAKIWNQFHGGGTLTTPSVDGKRVYICDRDGIFLCHDAETGEEIWKQDVKERYSVKPPTWGFSASPLVLDDMLILNINKTVAVDKKTGEKIWETRDSGHAYSTPIDFQLAGRRALAVFNGGGLAVFGLDKGDELFFYEWKTQYDVNAATPVVVGEKLFISSGLGKGCALLSPGEKEKSVVFENKEMRTSMAGCVLWEGHLYGFDDKNLKCIDLTGAEKWKERSIETGAAIVADGKLLVMDSQGELIVAKASPEKYEELSRAKVLDGGVYWTTPTLANGLIYCRSSLGDLVCRDHRAKPEKN
jgi:outer membrane protein assembly factor BamB